MYHLTPLFWYLGFHGNAILNFINTSKASTHYGEYYYDVLPQLPWKQKRGDLNYFWILFIKLHETLQEYPL
jgi:hypothetical protein